MSTAWWCRTFDIPARTWHRWQAKARAGKPAKGPWPQPARNAAAELIDKDSLVHPVWGHRKIWAMFRHDGQVVSEATVLPGCGPRADPAGPVSAGTAQVGRAPQGRVRG